MMLLTNFALYLQPLLIQLAIFLWWLFIILWKLLKSKLDLENK